MAAPVEGQLTSLEVSDLSSRSCTVLFRPSTDKWEQNLVFFQGDSQQFKNVMEEKYSQTKEYSQWCYENTAAILSKKFKNAAVWIACPYKMLRKVFCCYSQFVSSSMVGVPHYKGSYGGLPNLQHIFQKAVEHISLMKDVPGRLSCEEIHALPMILCGFSKGCVVLNQFLYELAYFETGHDLSCAGDFKVPDQEESAPASLIDEETLAEKRKHVSLFIEKISELIWLDSGHSGTAGIWVENKEVLENLLKLKVKLHIHATPYEVCCPNRPWIGEQYQHFMGLLKHLNVPVATEKLHFQNKDPSLENHFKLLSTF